MKGYLGEFEPGLFHKFKNLLYMNKERWAIFYIQRYGGIDGAHHKDWVLDQVNRILMGTPVIEVVAKWDNGFTELRHTTGVPSKRYLDFVKRLNEAGYEVNEGIAP